MTAAELLIDFSIKIYEPPLCEMRNKDTLRDLSNPVAVVMLIVDFETEVSMNGIINFIGNSTGLFANETVAALNIIGCAEQATQLQNILDIATAVELTHTTIQKERADFALYTVTTFSEMHGDTCNDEGEKINTLESQISYPKIMLHAEHFIARHHTAFHAALDH